MAPTGTNKRITAQTLGNFLPVTATGSSASRSLKDRFADTVNVKDFGAIGDGVTDDTAAIQAAANRIGVIGGGVLYIPQGTYKQNGGVTLSSNTTISAYGASIDCSDLAYSTTIGLNNPAYKANGALVATTTLASSVSKNAAVITVASAAGMEVGQIIQLRSTEISFVEIGITYNKYDVNRIKKISGTTITLENPCIDTLSITAGTVTIRTFSPIENISIKGMKLIGGGFKENLPNVFGQCGMVFNHARNILVKDCVISGFQGIAVNGGICLDIQCENVEFIGADNDLVFVEGQTSGFYAFYPSFSRRVTTSKCVGIRPRHLTDAISCIDVVQNNNHAVDTSRAAYGTHGNCWNVLVLNNTCVGCDTGVAARGINTRVEGNTFTQVFQRGVDTSASNRSDCSLIISNNSMEVIGGYAGQLGIGVSLQSNYSLVEISKNSISSKHDTISIKADSVKNTLITFNPLLSSDFSRCVVVGSDSDSSILNNINGLVIENNYISAPNRVLPIYIGGSRTTTAKAKNIRVANNLYTDVVSLGGNTFATQSVIGEFSAPVFFENNKLLMGGTDLIDASNFDLWTKTRTTTATSTLTSPVGDLTATRISDESGTSGTHFIRRTIPITAGTTYRYEIIAKSGSLTKINLNMDDAFAAVSVRLDLANKTVISSSGVDNIDIFNLFGDWVYCAITAKATTATDGLFTLFLIEEGFGSVFDGNGLRNVHVWGGRIKSVS